ncbi:MAG: flavin reductase family protein [Phycisphaeraceae bacterium]|nr:flavin reductase family protein [Phycisphaerales bacterium]MCB9861689.1 flavin reductase family protein [Phycisphaeraceae bacterium]
MNSHTTLLPDELSQRNRYKLLIGSVVPRPIFLVSTISREGVTNVAPFSFANAISAQPMLMMFCPANNDHGGIKDTLRNCMPESDGGMGQFVVNIVSHAMVRQMAACAEPLGENESEFDLAGLTHATSTKVKPPGVAESLVRFECETREVHRFAPDTPGGGNMVIGQVAAIHVHRDILDESTHIDPARLDAIGRMGGLGYCTTRDRFDLPMGKRALAPQ